VSQAGSPAPTAEPARRNREALLTLSVPELYRLSEDVRTGVAELPEGVANAEDIRNLASAKWARENPDRIRAPESPQIIEDLETVFAFERQGSERASSNGSSTGELDESPSEVLFFPPTSELLAAVVAELERFVVFANEHQAVAVAAWVLHTYVFRAFDTTAYLHVSSATKQSGKTRLFEVLALLAARAWLVVEASEAALFRTIEKKAPTLLLDEIDAAFGKDAEMMQGIRGILNAGFRKGASVPRCVGNSFEVVEFTVYCPKAFAGIGDKLPDTIVDRSIPIVLRRRSPTERRPERFRQARARAELTPLVAQLRAWARSEQVKSIGVHEVPLPTGLSDRQQDAWEPLFAVAELAGGEWPARVERAALALHGATEDKDLTVQLLVHVREAFDDQGGDRLTSVQLLEHLVNRGDASPWVGFWSEDLEHGGARLRVAGRALARMLDPLDIGPRKIRLGDKTRQGYERSDFEDAWARYVPRSHPSPEFDGTTEQRSSGLLFASVAPDPKSGSDQECSVVPSTEPGRTESAARDDAGEQSPPPSDADFDRFVFDDEDE
jgi:hypothetical protein